MLVLNCHIEIGDLVFRVVNQVSIKSSWKELIDRCTITLPKNIRLQGKDLRNFIKAGQKVTVKLGYDGDLKTEFEGFVASFKTDIPFQVICEDAVWQLKQIPINKTYRTVKLASLLSDMLPNGFEFNCLDSELGPVRIDRQTVTGVLRDLRDKRAISSFMRGGKLEAGYPYPLSPPKRIYHNQKNLVSTDLEYKTKDQVRIRVKAVSIQPDNKKLEVEIGDPEGALRTLHFFNLGETELKETAKREAEKLRYEGYRGSITAFGVPFISHGDIAVLQDGERPERNGEYYVDSVETTFGMQGFRRKIQLGPKAAL